MFLLVGHYLVVQSGFFVDWMLTAPSSVMIMLLVCRFCFCFFLTFSFYIDDG